uniref:Uncharacterized protein n=1 Tax=Timema genevievae TaxID=629358 RepID=A0A7R9K3U7_TIMGE|nr:unnamed protein product [Timema genevievae]
MSDQGSDNPHAMSVLAMDLKHIESSLLDRTDADKYLKSLYDLYSSSSVQFFILDLVPLHTSAHHLHLFLGLPLGLMPKPFRAKLDHLFT